MVCQRCGYRNEAGAEFCGSCGTFLEWAGETAADGSAVGDADPRDAGTAPTVPVESPAPPMRQAGPPSPAPPAANSADTGASAGSEPTTPALVGPPCPVCGMPVPRSRTFCPHCGADTRAPQAGARAAVVATPPTTRRLPSVGFGPIIVVGALVVVVAMGVVFLPGLFGGGEPESTATGGPAVSATATGEGFASASPSVAEIPSDQPEPSVTPPGNDPPTGAEASAAIVSFLEEFDAAYRAGDSAFLLDHLDPAVIAAYSRSACRDSIESFARSDFATKVDSVSEPAVWTFKPENGQSTIISVAYVVTGERTRAGRTTPLSMHLSFDEGTFYWFSASC